jgi:hypothetical protein
VSRAVEVFAAMNLARGHQHPPVSVATNHDDAAPAGWTLESAITVVAALGALPWGICCHVGQIEGNPT